VPALIATADTFVLDTVNAIMTSKAWTGSSVIFVTWDESDFTGTGPKASATRVVAATQIRVADTS